MSTIDRCLGLLLLFLMLSCQSIHKKQPDSSVGHINASEVKATQDIPQMVSALPSLPKPKLQKKQELYTAIVNKVPVEELLFSLARDANLNLDIDSDVSGLVTLNAIDQPLEAILERICQTINLIFYAEHGVLRIKRDTPYLKNYRIDYINMARGAESKVAVSTQINSTGQGAGTSTAGGGAGNNSSTQVTNTSSNDFWDTLSLNIAAIIDNQNATSLPSSEPESHAGEATVATNSVSTNAEGGGASNNIILNRESGVIGVRATKKQHAEIERFITEVQFSTQRQVLIEATIAEVTLSDRFQAGIDWNMLSSDIADSLNISQQMSDISLFNRPAFTFQVDDNKANGESIQGTLSALESFGDVKIMSSPKVMTLNNQTALLKVVDNLVYFTVEVSIETSSTDTSSAVGFATYETEVNTVPVGFVMSVTPYISENDSVTLNVRPTISRVIRQARDPNPALAQVGVISEIPVIQVREVESILKVSSGDIAVMGGLMQDEVSKQKRGVPVLSRLPFIGSLFRYDDNITEKTELVIFIRPIVIKHASINTDLKSFKDYLPKSDR